MISKRKEKDVSVRNLAIAWARLRAEADLGPIRSQKDYSIMSQLLDRLVDEVGDDEKHPLASLVDVVATLLERYEDENVEIPATAPHAVLSYLMESHGLSQSDLRDEVGSQGVVSEVLRGKRHINARQAKALAKRFGVSPAVFL
jgi:HTH-type transcriptional regulator/antitoxin HigA